MAEVSSDSTAEAETKLAIFAAERLFESAESSCFTTAFEVRRFSRAVNEVMLSRPEAREETPVESCPAKSSTGASTALTPDVSWDMAGEDLRVETTDDNMDEAVTVFKTGARPV